MNTIEKILWACLALTAIALVFLGCSESASAMAPKPRVVVPAPMDSNFDYAMKTVLRHEGGPSNDKADPGGITNYGVSLRFLKDEHIDVNGDGKIDSNDVIHLTQTEADAIYLNKWWLAYHYNEIQDRNVATKVLDFSVNSGACRAHKLVKSSLNHILIKQIKVNCNLDEKDIDALNHIDEPVIMAELRIEEAEFYRDIVKRNSHLSVFLKGWLKRAAD